MNKTADGEIVLKEKYGSLSREILFIKTKNSNKFQILDKRKPNYFVSTWFTNVFLPKGFPESVSNDYISYQIWDTLQAFCSTITGILATQEVLRGVGVGDYSATPLAATITWVVKDGCGHIGRIVFAFTHGTNLDAYSKKWRLYADVLNDAAMCLELGLSFLSGFTTLILCCSTIMKAIVGVAGGATRMAMTQHHATRGNLADVSAKDSAQETTVNLVASVTALFIITVVKNPYILNLIFGLLIISHIICNYKAVRATCLQTFNEPRLLQTLGIYMKEKKISTPNLINNIEPIIWHRHFYSTKLHGFKINIGVSIKKFVHENGIDGLVSLKKIYVDRKYIIISDINKKLMYIALKEKNEETDILSAYYHAVLLVIIICKINGKTLDIYNYINELEAFNKLCQILDKHQYSSSSTKIFTENITEEMLLCVNEVVNSEWSKISNALSKVGWDLRTHLLVVDEWRISEEISKSELINIDNTFVNHSKILNEQDSKKEK